MGRRRAQPGHPALAAQPRAHAVFARRDPRVHPAAGRRLARAPSRPARSRCPADDAAVRDPRLAARAARVRGRAKGRSAVESANSRADLASARLGPAQARLARVCRRVRFLEPARHADDAIGKQRANRRAGGMEVAAYERQRHDHRDRRRRHGAARALLPALRLEQDARAARRHRPATLAAQDLRTRRRNGPHAVAVSARPVARDGRPRRVLRAHVDDRGLRDRPADRHFHGARRLHPLRRLRDRARARAARGAAAVRQSLRVRRRGDHLRRRADPRELVSHAAARRRAHRPASAGRDLRIARVRPTVRLFRRAARSARQRDHFHRAARDAPWIPRERALQELIRKKPTDCVFHRDCASPIDARPRHAAAVDIRQFLRRRQCRTRGAARRARQRARGGSARRSHLLRLGRARQRPQPFAVGARA